MGESQVPLPGLGRVLSESEDKNLDRPKVEPAHAQSPIHAHAALGLVWRLNKSVSEVRIDSVMLPLPPILSRGQNCYILGLGGCNMVSWGVAILNTTNYLQ